LEQDEKSSLSNTSRSATRADTYTGIFAAARHSRGSPGGYGSAEFLARYYELKNDSRAPAAGACGTVAALVASHTRSPYWTQKIGDESRRTQLSVLNRFSREHGTMPIKRSPRRQDQ
jgi:hypothetical protein